MALKCRTVSSDDLAGYVSLTEKACSLLGAQASSVSTLAGVCFEYLGRADRPLGISFEHSLNTSMDSKIAFSLLRYIPVVSWACNSVDERHSQSRTVT
jgi:hypothetical protein